MKILVLGTGGIGGYFGARLVEAGGDVFFVARGAHLKAMQHEGLQLTSVNGDFHARSVAASDDPQKAGRVDLVMHCTKTWDLEDAGRLLKPVMQDHTVVITFQNGIDNVDRLAKFYDRKHLTGGIAFGVVSIAGPGKIKHTSKNVHKLVMGPLVPKQSQTLKQFYDLCTAAKFDAVWSENIEKELWNKFVMICAYSGVTSLIRKSIGPIMDDPESRDFYKNCMLEVRQVAAAKSVKLDDGIVDHWLNFVSSLEKGATSSMQRDLENGFRLELENLNGTVSRLGKELNVPTPINDFIYTSLKPHAQGRTHGV